MNPIKQTIEDAIRDLRQNRETVRQIYEEWASMGQNPDPDYYKKVQKLDADMKKAQVERKNIAVRLFRDYVDGQGNPVVGNPNEAFYDPNPTPMFNVGDFYRGPGIKHTKPSITTPMTTHARHGNMTLRRIDKFIKRLREKSRTRKDLQENNPFQLTEAKLKQMILEAVKKKYDGTPFVDFGIPTPDERLRSELGNEMFDKIQSLDPEQAEIMKQSYDPNYPREIKLETFEDLLKPFGFKKVYSELRSQMGDPKRIKAFDAHISDPKRADRFYIDYKVLKVYDLASIKYRASLWSEKEKDNVWEVKTRFGYKSIEIGEMFDHEIESDEGDRTVESIILAKEKEDILAALEKLT